jgi:hypothetical protein
VYARHQKATLDFPAGSAICGKTRKRVR